MNRGYLVYCVIVGILMMYADAYGWRMIDVFTTGKWGPHMQAHYHK